MTKMTPNEFYALTPIAPINDVGDSLLRTLIEFLAEQQVWQIHIPEVNKVRSHGLNWVTMDKLPEINVKTYVDYSQETSGDWRKYIYSLWYMNSPCALVHAGGKYSDDLHIVVTDVRDFVRLVDNYLHHALDVDSNTDEVDDYVCEPDSPIDYGLFSKEYLERYYDPKPNISVKVGDVIMVNFEVNYKMRKGLVTIDKINPHKKLNRYRGVLKEPIGYQTHVVFSEDDIVKEYRCS